MPRSPHQRLPENQRAEGQTPSAEPVEARGARPGNTAAAAAVEGAGRKQQEEQLTFIQSRLSTVAELQRREVEQTSNVNRRTWWDEVADTHKQRKGLRKPEPGQWAACARHYQQAAQAAAQGDAVAAARAIRDALRTEAEAREHLTRLVRADDLDAPGPSPWAHSVSSAPTPAVPVPRQIQALTRAILAEQRSVPDSPVRIERRGPAPVVAETEEEPDAAKAPVEAPKKPSRRSLAPRRRG